MAKLTITEALAEIKTINARLAKKRQAVLSQVVRDDRIKDPFLDTGGSKEFIVRERDGIRDLEKRLVAIRAAIQLANHATKVEVCGATRTVADWLTWRREVSKDYTTMVQGMLATLASARNEVRSRQGEAIALVISVDEPALIAENEKVTEVLGALDGKLSLINATTTIEVE